MPRDVTADQCCLRMANVKDLVEAIHAVKSPNKSQVCLACLNLAHVTVHVAHI